MKRFLLLVLSIIILLPLSAEKEEIKLFSSSEELASFKAEGVTDEDRGYYESMKIYLLVGGPGSHIWENFGHSAFIVETEDFPSVAFDYGIFTFDDTFIPNFIFGKLYYQVWETYAEYRILSLEESDRDVYKLLLNLDADEKKALFSFLLYNTEEENRTYLYRYFDDNCATRLRDIYSYVTGGDFERYLKSQESTESIRESVSRYLSRSTFAAVFVINYLLGPSVDREITRWDECYLPDNLKDAVEDYQKSKSEEIYLSQKRSKTPDKWSLVIRSLICGVILALFSAAASYSKHSRPFDTVLAIIFLVFSIMSLVLIFFSLFTIHDVTHDNVHILLISPLCLVSSILHFSSLGKKGRKEKKTASAGLVMLIVSLLCAAFKIIFPGILIQNIWATALLVLPLYLAEALPLFIKKRN